MTVDQAKILLRAKARKRRAALAPEAAAAAGQHIADIFSRHIELGHEDILGGYAPTSSEIDCWPLLRMASARGCATALPVVTDPASPLTFFAWRPDAPLVTGAFGIRVPEDQTVPLVPTIILVPLLAFDLEGHRLGYGGGYYDRTIAFLRHHHGRGALTAIGVAFEAQGVDKVPHVLHDQRLDGVITEENFYDFGLKAGNS